MGEASVLPSRLRKKDLTGKTFGRLTVLEFSHMTKVHTALWRCRCACGKELLVLRDSLITGNTKSCGCLRTRLVPEETAFNRVVSSYKTGAKRRNLCWELDKTDIRRLFEGLCNYCGATASNFAPATRANGGLAYNGIDRVRNLEGYTKENTVSSCFVCNKMKGSLSLEEFLSQCTKIVRHQNSTSVQLVPTQPSFDGLEKGESALLVHSKKPPAQTQPRTAQSGDENDLIGKRFQNLTVLKFARAKGKTSSHWLCTCVCGKLRVVSRSNLTSGRVKSCGCWRGRPLAPGESIFKSILNCYKNHAKDLNVSWDLAVAEVKGFFAGDCVYCGVPPSNLRARRNSRVSFRYNGIDRIDAALGYFPANCVSSCKRCNFLKLNYAKEDFLNQCRKIVEHSTPPNSVEPFLSKI